ncbi:hypothetical protein [Nitrosomonas sp.]|uniref:ubiquinone biosynthesis accessory factor UbiJ n=1 Tax=Nitrosomonas sp. TaxID=42353 RepID=UPI0025FFB55A|nr:hypothetical protein [Nitrosomonas sp.]MCC6916925.1 hypothetical protein [Nitrosomonas sp.]
MITLPSAQSSVSSIFTRPLISCLNRLTGRSGQIRQRLQAHAGETVCFRIDAFADLYVAITQAGQFTAAGNDAQTRAVTVTLDIPAGLPARIASGDREAFGKIIAHGDPVLADTLIYTGKIFQAEIEENLSSVIGDVFARRVTLTGQELVRWHLDGIHAVSRSLGEFLSEERPAIVNRARFHQLVSETSSLQQQLSRLEERIGRLVTSFPAVTGHLPGADQ